MQGGYLPRIAGRPSGELVAAPVPDELRIALAPGGRTYDAAVREGDTVSFGQALGWFQAEGIRLALPSPAAGTITAVEAAADGREPAEEAVVRLKVTDTAASAVGAPLTPERASADEIRAALARGGLWPFAWSSATDGLPVLDGSESPAAIIVNCVLAEPFRARGNVVLQQQWDRIMSGIGFLPRLLADYGTIEIALTAAERPLARRIRAALSGQAWTHFHDVPLRYPVEHPRVLHGLVRKARPTLPADAPVWKIDLQGVAAIGAMLAEGIPHHETTIALGGPGCPQPRHTTARVGTPLAELVPEGIEPSEVLVLRGGLLNGTPADPARDAVTLDGDALFFLPLQMQREFLSFLRPGFDRTSCMPCFAAQLLGRPDSHITASLRGERRACIACGRCEQVCPVDLMPQLLHRYLYRDALDEAAAVGLNRCIECRLCTFVCPSKIELREQFVKAKQQLEAERLAAEEAQKSEDEQEEKA